MEAGSFGSRALGMPRPMGTHVWETAMRSTGSEAGMGRALDGQRGCLAQRSMSASPARVTKYALLKRESGMLEVQLKTDALAC